MWAWIFISSPFYRYLGQPVADYAVANLISRHATYRQLPQLRLILLLHNPQGRGGVKNHKSTDGQFHTTLQKLRPYHAQVVQGQHKELNRGVSWLLCHTFHHKPSP